MSGPTQQEMKEGMRLLREALDALRANQSLIIHEAIVKAQNRHGGLRAAARALKIDPGYLQRLKSGEKTNPSDDVLRKLKLK